MYTVQCIMLLAHVSAGCVFFRNMMNSQLATGSHLLVGHRVHELVQSNERVESKR